MPFERRDVAERTIFPKHLLSRLQPAQLVVTGGGGVERIFVADLLAEEGVNTGIGFTVDGVTVQDGMLVLVRPLGTLYRARANVWDVVRVASDGDVFLVRQGQKYGGTHAFTAEYIRSHSAFAVRSGSVNYTLNTNWTELQATEEVLQNVFTTLGPFGFEPDVIGEGIYSIDVLLQCVSTDTVGATIELGLFLDGALIPFDQPVAHTMVALGNPIGYLQASLVWRIAAGERFSVALRANTVVNVAVKFYAGGFRLL